MILVARTGRDIWRMAVWKTQFASQIESGKIVTGKESAGLGINFLDSTRKNSSSKDGAAESDANTSNSVPGRKVEKCHTQPHNRAMAESREYAKTKLT